MKTSHHMDCIALIATSKTNYKEWPYVSMFSWSIDHLKNGRQMGELLEEDCWANKPAERVSAGQRSACRSLHSFVDIQTVVTCARRCTSRCFNRRGVRKIQFLLEYKSPASLDSVTDSFLGEKQIFGSFLTDLCSRLLWKDNKKLVSSSSQTFPRGNLRRKGGK